MPLLLVAAWQWAVTTGAGSSQKIAAPSAVLKAGWRLTLSHELPLHLWESTKRALLGLVVGGSLGLALGFLNGVSAWANRLFDSSVQMLRNVPHLALIPLAIVWFGVGEEAKQFLIVLGVLFPLYINTVHGIRSIDPKLSRWAACTAWAAGNCSGTSCCRARCPRSSWDCAMRSA